MKGDNSKIKEKVVYFLLDAVRSDYISKDTTPFLFRCANDGQYFRNVKPSLSFCERSEIFTGEKPNVTGNFTAIGYDPSKSPYRKALIVKILSVLEKIPLFKSRVLKIKPSVNFRLYKKNKYSLSFYRIPLSFLKYFRLTEDYYDFSNEKAFSGIQSIYTELRNKNYKIFDESFTSLNAEITFDDKTNLEIALNAASQNFDLYLVYIGMIDKFGHLFGPNDPKLKAKLKELDGVLESFVKSFKGIAPNTKFIFNGDHGMSQVVEIIDVETELLSIAARNKLKVEKDFLYFLDSTLLRLWFFNEKTASIFKSELKSNRMFSRSGFEITKEIAQNEEIPFGNTLYGDYMWIAQEGTLIFPDFFHTDSPCKGMHGYLPKTRSTKGMCIIHGDKVKNLEKNEIELTDIYHKIKESLNI